MLGKSVLLYTADRVGARLAARRLRAAGNEVAQTGSARSAADLVTAHAVDLVLVDCTDPSAIAEVVDVAADHIPLVAVSTESDPMALLDLVCEHRVQHFIGASGEHRTTSAPFRSIDHRELVVTVEKILQRDIFGISKYLPEFGCEISVCDVNTTKERREVIDCVQEYLRTLGAGHRYAATCGLVADELLANAIFRAPRDEHGHQRFAAADRRAHRALAPRDRPRVTFGSDGRYFALAVADRYGALRPEHLRSALRRYRDPRDPLLPALGTDALGLYTALSSSTQLVINIAPDQRTEVIALFDLERRMRGLHARGHSLHVFMNRRPDAVPELYETTTSKRVLLSESLRVDLRTELATTDRRAVVPRARAAPRPLSVRGPLPARHPSDIELAEPKGFDTVRGLLRGAARADAAVETALRFLASDYCAAVAYRVAGSDVVPHMAVGRLEDWLALDTVTIGLDDACAVAVSAREGVVHAFAPWRRESDGAITDLVTAEPGPALAIPIAVNGAVELVLAAFAPRFGELIDPLLLAAVRRELEHTLERIEGSYYADIVIEQRRVPTVPPYDAFELS